MSSPHYAIRNMTKQDIKTAIDWAAAEGWNPGLHDAESFYAADPNGFLIGEIDGEPISTLSAVKYGNSFGFMGFYIVKPTYRGKGYGIQLWNAGIKYLAGRNIGLDGVLEQQENYKKFGFKFAYRNIRYEGVNESTTLPEKSNITDLSSIPFEEIQSYDEAFFPEERSIFLKSWVRQSGHQALGIIEDKRLAGYGVIRKCREGYKIGPLFAETPELAESLFTALSDLVERSAPIYLDVPEANTAAISIAEKYKMKPIFETARMYTINAPTISIQKIFGVTSFELG
ncbi:MAG: GNAT family N-acetyltransferase [Gammaproteobacteria bacterium]|nr:GNAT family N-acetyltransferase [Gammaproteobacteria bacterium]